MRKTWVLLTALVGACSSATTTTGDAQPPRSDLVGEMQRDAGSTGDGRRKEGGVKDAAASLSHAWSKRFGSNGADSVGGVAVDTNGNVTIVGSFQGTVSFGGKPLVSWAKSDIFVAGFDKTGAHRWSQRFGGSEDEHAHAVTVDANGNVTLTGSFRSTQLDFGGGVLGYAGQNDIFVASFDPTGAHRWSKRFGTNQGYADRDVGKAIVADANGNVTVTGRVQPEWGPVDFGGGPLTGAGNSDIFVLSLDAAGTYRWAKLLGAGGWDDAAAVAVDGSGNVAITGNVQSSVDFGGGPLPYAGLNDIFVASFGPMGLHRWSKAFGFPKEDFGTGVAFDGAGNLFVTGHFEGSINFGGGMVSSSGGHDIFLASFDGAGKYRWANPFGGADQEIPNALVADAAGNLFMTGYFSGTTDLGGGSLTSAGAEDVLLAGFTPKGAHRWSRSYGYPAGDGGNALALDGAGGLSLVGDFTVGMDFGGNLLISQGGTDVFLAKFAP